MRTGCGSGQTTSIRSTGGALTDRMTAETLRVRADIACVIYTCICTVTTVRKCIWNTYNIVCMEYTRYMYPIPYTYMCQVYIPGIYVHPKSYPFIVFNACIHCLGGAHWYIGACTEEGLCICSYSAKIILVEYICNMISFNWYILFIYGLQIKCLYTVKKQGNSWHPSDCACHRRIHGIWQGSNAQEVSFTDKWNMIDIYMSYVIIRCDCIEKGKVHKLSDSL